MWPCYPLIDRQTEQRAVADADSSYPWMAESSQPLSLLWLLLLLLLGVAPQLVQRSRSDSCRKCILRKRPRRITVPDQRVEHVVVQNVANL